MAQPISLVDPDRFWARVERRSRDECWTWTGRVHHQGYGEYRRKIAGRNVEWRAHRVAYELLVGPIPSGLVIDHLCRNRACVNPAHMEPVTGVENTRRSRGHLRGPMGTACRNGHPYEPGSYYLRGGRWRVCRRCNRGRQARYEERRRSR